MGESWMRVLKLILKKYPLAVMILLFGGIVFVGAGTARTVYQAFSYTPPARTGDRKMQEETVPVRPGLDRYAVIVQRDLFAAASATEDRAEANPGAPATATVPFKLKGTVVVTPGVSFAIVEDAATKKEEILHERDVVQGFKIVKIMRNKMIVDRNGSEEVVEVLDEQDKTPAGTRTPVQRPTTIQRQPAPVRSPLPIKTTPSGREGP
jgi:type II secretory pathway component PulC